MKKRYNCEFKNCYCHKFINNNNNLCQNCNHSKIWHAKKTKPPSDDYLSFTSPRKPARSGRYTYLFFPVSIGIFIPEAVAVPVEECVEYCTNFDSLPI